MFVETGTISMTWQAVFPCARGTANGASEEGSLPAEFQAGKFGTVEARG